MSTSATTFDDSIARWKQEMDFPWGKLKYKLVQANLARYVGRNQLRILDAGGGNGLDSIPFAVRSHSVDIVDYSREMLADATHQAALVNAHEHVTTHHADVRDIPSLFPNLQFGLTLCHNVLQYISDVPALLKDLAESLKPGGIISVVSINKYSAPYHAAFLGDNLAEALAQLEARTSKAKIFDAVITNYCADEISEILRLVGFVVEKDYGIRCICDYWGDNERKSDPATFEQIERFEFALTGLYPYKLLARYFQIIARKANH
jgi:S-adenosylmethionine-dependent methyltransferase